jgi:iron complex outermembrane receptor protein
MSELSRTCSRFALLSSSASLMLGAVLAVASAVAPAQAQNAAAPSGSDLEEIVVTAERRSTNIQTTPLAITAVSADTLEKDNINQLADINGRVPG